MDCVAVRTIKHEMEHGLIQLQCSCTPNNVSSKTFLQVVIHRYFCGRWTTHFENSAADQGEVLDGDETTVVYTHAQVMRENIMLSFASEPQHRHKLYFY